MFGDARREAALECKGKPDRLLFHSSSYSSLFGFLKKTGKSLLFSLFPRFGSLLWSPSALFPSLPLPSRMIVDTETTIGLSGLQAKGCAGSQKSSGARAALADGPRVACPLAPGTSASLASAGATNGGAGPGARPRRRGRGPRAVRGAAAVAVTSREGVGAARQQPDYKRTRPAAAGVARRPSPPPPLLAPAPFFFFFLPTSTSSSSSSIAAATAAVSAPQLSKKVQKLDSEAAGSRAAATSGSRWGAPRARSRPGFAVAAPVTSAAAAAAWCQAVGRQTQAAAAEAATALGSPPAACAFAWVPCAASRAPRAWSFLERRFCASSTIFVTFPWVFLSSHPYFLHKETKKVCVETVYRLPPPNYPSFLPCPTVFCFLFSFKAVTILFSVYFVLRSIASLAWSGRLLSGGVAWTSCRNDNNGRGQRVEFWNRHDFVQCQFGQPQHDEWRFPPAWRG